MPRNFAGTENSLLRTSAIACLIGILSLGSGHSLASQSSSENELRGRQIMQQVYQNSIGQNRVSREELTLVQDGKKPRIRHLDLFRKVDEKNVSTLIRFTNPENVRRTGLLSIERPDGSADQWIFIPAARAVRRIPGARLGDRFAGSDFFYEDILLRNAAREDYRWLSTEIVQNQHVDLIESLPSQSQSSAYTRRLLWIDTEKSIPLRIEFFRNAETTPFKRFETLDTAFEAGQYSIINAVMHDLETGHSSYLRSRSIEYHVDLPDHLFTTQALEDGHFEAQFSPSP